MAKSKRKTQSKPKGKKGGGLEGLSGAKVMNAIATDGVNRWQVGGALLAVVGGGLIGANLGKISGPIGLGLGLAGVGINNLYVTSAGVGMLISKIGDGLNGTDGLNGFSLETIKQRSTSYFKDIAGKFIPEKDPQPTDTGQPASGINGSEVSYFINPYQGAGELDLTELDKIQQQIAQMNGAAGIGEIDYTARNF